MPTSKKKKKMLSKAKRYTLKEALHLGRTYEATTCQVSHLRDMQESTTGATIRHVSQTLAETGRRHPFKPRSKRPAFSTRCKACGKVNHWATVCESKKDDKPKHHRSQPQQSRQNLMSKNFRNVKAEDEMPGFDMLTFDHISIQQVGDET